MKKLILASIGLYLILGIASAFADPEVIQIPSGITMKQGMLLKWNDPTAGVLNLSTFSVAETVASEHFSNWENALWEGWSLDAGFAYDANSFGVAALMIGRDFGNIGKYLPVKFPLADKFSLTVYPLGMIVEDPTGHPSIKGASGLGVIKLSVSF